MNNYTTAKMAICLGVPIKAVWADGWEDVTYPESAGVEYRSAFDTTGFIRKLREIRSKRDKR